MPLFKQTNFKIVIWITTKIFFVANEEPQDLRPLYERLKEQKDKKQEEFEDQLKFSMCLVQ